MALLDGRVVGMVGSTYVRFNLEGKRVRASLVGGLVTLPSARSWRIFTGLLRVSGERAVRDGISFGYAFVLPRVVPLNRRLGNAVIGRIPVYAGFLDFRRFLRARGWPAPVAFFANGAMPFLGACIPGAAAPNVDVRTIEQFDAEVDVLWEEARRSREVCAVRDARYLNWRYIQHPDFDYRCAGAYQGQDMLGVVVYRVIPHKGVAYITELLATGERGSVLRALLRHALLDVKSDGIGMVTASFPAQSPAARVLVRAGFQPAASRLWNLSLCVITGENGELPELNMGKWYFSLGDWLTQ